MKALRLLLSPRLVSDRNGRFLTRRAALMGEPGTKATLTLIGLLAFGSTAAVDAHPNGLFNRSAGDDFINRGPINVIRRQVNAAALLSAKISTEKTHCYKNGVLYCEEAIIPPSLEYLTHSRKVQPTDFKVDFPKMRLLSTERKENLGDSDTDSNPAIGKFMQFHNMINWYGPDAPSEGMKNIYRYLFFRAMRQSFNGTKLLPTQEWILRLP